MTANGQNERAKTLVSEFFRLLKEQLNLALFASALIYWWLTGDRTMWPYFLLIEILYLSFCFNKGPLPEFLKEIAKLVNFPHLKPLEWRSFSSLVLLASGILFTVLHPDRISVAGESISRPYGRWEVAALVWNMAYAAVSFRFLPPRNKPWSRFIVWILFFAVAYVCMKQAFAELARGNYSQHLTFVLMIAIFYVIIDVILWREDQDNRKLYLDLAFYADLPTAIALLALLAFSGMNKNEVNMGIFLSGAVAFQFIASSLIVACIEGRKPDSSAATTDPQSENASAARSGG